MTRAQPSQRSSTRTASPRLASEELGYPLGILVRLGADGRDIDEAELEHCASVAAEHMFA